MIAVSASLCIMLHQQYAGMDEDARAAMKQAVWELIEPLMKEAAASGMKVEAYVEQLTSQEQP